MKHWWFTMKFEYLACKNGGFYLNSWFYQQNLVFNQQKWRFFQPNKSRDLKHQWAFFCWESSSTKHIILVFMWGPPVISGFRFAPVTIDISTINHSYWSYNSTIPTFAKLETSDLSDEISPGHQCLWEGLPMEEGPASTEPHEAARRVQILCMAIYGV